MKASLGQVKWLFLAMAIGFEVSATLSLRASQGFSKLGFAAVVLVGYPAAFACLAVVLKKGLPVGVAYGIWSACGVAIVALLGKALFGDPLTPLMGIGIILLIGGVLLVQLGST